MNRCIIYVTLTILLFHCVLLIMYMYMYVGVQEDSFRFNIVYFRVIG